MLPSGAASPGTRAGRGLKPATAVIVRVLPPASPGTRAGRGLKLTLCAAWAEWTACIARHTCRARIETRRATLALHLQIASPGTRAGRGLKLVPAELPSCAEDASPGTRAGRGLKPLGFGRGSAWFLHRPAHVPGAD